MSARHANISVFVPHVGCENRCSFCDQVTISGSSGVPTANDIKKAVALAESSKNYDPKNTELAFFGGSFTAIKAEYRRSLLKVGAEFVKNGTVRGIRVSTRPDAISADLLSELSAYGVTAVELGAQSMDDRVLKLNRRGHTAADVKNAAQKIKAANLELGLQMMTGLYGDTDDGALKTAADLAALSPETVRIYPTIVLRDTYLFALYEKGVYKPQTVESAVTLCAELLKIFHRENIRVIRLGLHDVDQTKVAAGPWHPAFGELCESRLYLNLALAQLKKLPRGRYDIFVSPSAVSKTVGQHRQNLETLSAAGYDCCVKISKALPPYHLEISSHQSEKRKERNHAFKVD